MANQENVLQLTLFETRDRRQVNYLAVYDLAPRFVSRVDRKEEDGGWLPDMIREFEYGGESYKLKLSPARISDGSSKTIDVFPGEREQLVEDVIRKFAAEGIHLGGQDQVVTRFSIYNVQRELAQHNHTFSKREIREAFEILHGSNIAITKVLPEGKKGAKPVVSSSAFPVLYWRNTEDDGEPAYVQLNPLLVQAIKSLAYEQVNFEWMMQLRNSLPRWVFKRMSLLMAESQTPSDVMEMRASDIVNNYGMARTRVRETLAEAEKAMVQLREASVIADYVKTDVKDGRKKVDVIFEVRFTEKFMKDRASAQMQGQFLENQAQKRGGRKNLNKFLPITSTEAAEIRLERQALSKAQSSLLPN